MTRAIIFFLLFVPFSFAASESVPPDVLYNVNLDREHSISPNGEKIAFLSHTAASTFINIVDISSFRLENKIKLGVHTYYDLDWINNHRLIVNEQGTIRAVSISGSENIIIANRVYDEENRSSYRKIVRNLKNWRVIDLLNDQPEWILLRGINKNNFSNIAKVNVYTGEKIDLANGAKHKINRWRVDKNGSVRLGIRYKKDRIEYLKVGKKGDNISLSSFRLDGKELNSNGETALREDIFFVDFDYQSNIGYFAENTARNTYRIIRYDLESDKLLNVVAEDPEFDILSSTPEVRESPLIFDKKVRSLAGINFLRDQQTTKWFDTNLKNIQNELDRMRPSEVNNIKEWNHDKNLYLVHSSNSTNPGSTWIYLKKQQKYVTISRNIALENYSLPKTEYISINIGNGKSIPAYITLPNIKKGSNIPLVVIPHGGPWLRDTMEYDPDVIFFSSRGYAVLRPQFRGSRGFGKDHLLAGRKQWGGVMIDDIASSVKWMQKNYAIDSKKIFIFGYSYGGYAALMCSYRYPKTFSAAVSLFPVLDLISNIRHVKKIGNIFNYSLSLYFIGDPKLEKEALMDDSPISHISDINIPVHIYSGEYDQIIPIEQHEKFSKEVRKKKKGNIKTTIFTRNGHGFRLPSTNIYVVENAIQLFESSK